MRNVPPFECPRCGESMAPLARCARCNVWPRDRQGAPPLPPTAERLLPPPEYRVPTAGVAVVALIVAAGTQVWLGIGWIPALVAVGLIAAPLLRTHLARRASPFARMLRRHASSRGPHPIARSSGETAHVRGRVRVSRAVRESPSGPLGAYLVIRDDSVTVRLTHTDADGHETYGFAHGGGDTVEAACGRFAVIDDTGVAVVDDDAFDLWGTSFIRVGKDRVLTVADGCEVEILGPAHLASEPEVEWQAGETSYRGPRRVLRFEGNAKQRVLIWVVRAAPLPPAS